MGRDNSSDEDYEPARKKTRTGRKGRADEEHKAGEGGDEGRGDSAKGTESRLNEGPEARRACALAEGGPGRSSADKVRRIGVGIGANANLQLAQGPGTSQDAEQAASPEPPKPEETQDPPKAPAPAKTPPKPAASPEPPKTEETQDPSKAQAETQDPLEPEVTEDQSVVKAAKAPPEQEEKQDPSAGDPPGGNPSKVETMDEKQAPVAPSLTLEVAVSSPKPTPSRGMFSPHAPVENSGDSSDEKSETPTQMTNPFADLPVDEAPIELPGCYLFLDEKRPRERRSGTSDTRSKIAQAHVDVPNHADAIPRLGYRSWSQVMLALEYYAALKGLRYRIRSSQPIARCPSRGGGVRESKVNFTDCKARFDAVVTRVETKEKQMVWCILIKNEWGMHNHHADKGKRVRGINDVPADGPVADHIAALADAGGGVEANRVVCHE
ncbi:hypothetical protein PF010_g2257 [Phytophthora fragariae]|uniref:Uncharacterized protein n=1 Tax=Phytophthora fragariae TaxID=53985 RepID=A0A6G0LXN3_9STRA|nr:hypothetical protein PF010_g2257 [Phytophthora fragariae]